MQQLSVIYLLIPALLFFNFFVSSSSYYGVFSDCNRSFSCGNISNISYPFTGGNQPDYCGLSAYKLTCSQPENITLLTHNSITYRVIQLDLTSKTMTISRADFSNTTCPSHFVNSTFDSKLLSPPTDLDNSLTLFYGCNSIPNGIGINPPNLFHCAIDNLNFSGGYYLVGPVPSDRVLRLVNCSFCVSVPVMRSVGVRLDADNISLDQALNEGFTVNYTDPYESICSDCARVGGYCVFDLNMGKPECNCGDRPCVMPAKDPSPKGRKSDTKTNIVLPIIGAVLAGILFGWIVFFCRQRRKRLALVSKQLSIDTKELPTTPLTKKESNTSPSIAFTKSIPSYPSTKSDFGRNSSYFGAKMFTYNELVAATENFAEARELGDGGFGAVYHGTLPDGCAVAVKRLYENNYKRVEQFMNEIEILTKLRHSNLVTLFGCTSKESRELLLVYEYIPNGTVADHLHGKLAKSGLLTWPVRLNIAIETARALAYLHASDIIHRDVKTTNILLDNDCHVKVADFGLCRLFPINATHVTTAPQGTPGYVDPDYHQCYQLTEKSDVYSFGVVLIELISSLPAVDTNRHRHDINLSNMAIDRIQNHRLHELVDPKLQFETNSSIKRMITSVAELAFRCLQQEKDMRPSMQEVLDNLIALKVEVVTIVVDDGARLLKGNNSPLSPDTVMAKWDSGSTMVSYG